MAAKRLQADIDEIYLTITDPHQKSHSLQQAHEKGMSLHTELHNNFDNKEGVHNICLLYRSISFVSKVHPTKVFQPLNCPWYNKDSILESSDESTDKDSS